MNTQQTISKYAIPLSVFEKLSEEIGNNEGYIETDIEDGEMQITFEGYYDVTCVTENNYYLGTGASYYSRVNISLTCTVYNTDGDKVANDYRDSEFEKYLLS